MPLFNRIVSVLIGPEGSEQGIEFSGIRVVFKINKTKKKDSNTCNVELYNLSAATRNFIKDLNNIMILNAGYVESTGLEHLFTGNLININHVKQGPDWISKLEVNDGSKAINDTRINLSYKEGASSKQILSDVIDSIPLAKRFVDLDRIEDSQEVNGFSFAGQSKTVLDKLAEKLNFEWSVQDNQIQIIKSGETNNDAVIVISPDSGLIGSPERLEDLSEEKASTTKLPGWRVNSLLLPKVSIGGTVSVESREIKKNSFFKIHSIEHSGDTHGQNWNTVLEVTEKK